MEFSLSIYSHSPLGPAALYPLRQKVLGISSLKNLKGGTHIQGRTDVNPTGGLRVPLAKGNKAGRIAFVNVTSAKVFLCFFSFICFSSVVHTWFLAFVFVFFLFSQLNI